MTIRYERRAISDIGRIHRHIARSDEGAAKRVVLRIERAIGRLEIAPLSGRQGVVPGSRLLVVPGLPYVVVHRVRGDTVEIVAVVHTRQSRRS